MNVCRLGHHETLEDTIEFGFSSSLWNNLKEYKVGACNTAKSVTVEKAMKITQIPCLQGVVLAKESVGGDIVATPLPILDVGTQAHIKNPSAHAGVLSTQA